MKRNLTIPFPEYIEEIKQSIIEYAKSSHDPNLLKKTLSLIFPEVIITQEMLFTENFVAVKIKFLLDPPSIIEFLKNKTVTGYQNIHTKKIWINILGQYLLLDEKYFEILKINNEENK